MTLPKGLYDLLITPEVRSQLERLATGTTVNTRQLKGLERRLRLVADISQRVSYLLEESEGSDAYTQLELATVNRLLAELRADEPTWTEPVEALVSIGIGTHEPPATGLHNPWLFAAGKGDPSLLGELRAELSSANRVDIIVSFITWSGVRRLIDLLTNATAADANGNSRTQFRILTTTYTGATEERALTWLARLPGVTVKVSLDGRRTRLHAKAWIFRREADFGSAYVGSANLSGAALTGGLEWTIKVTQAGQRDIYEKSIAHFETLWADPEFQTYDPSNPEHIEQLKTALRREKHGPTADSDGDVRATTWFDIEPKPFQQIILDRLAHEREHARFRNLVVAATGTGKTVIAALDYRRICQREGGKPRLLFVAHRQEILQQAINTYRQVLRDPTFGDLLVGGSEPSDKQHLFTTIQSAISRNIASAMGSEYWRVVVVDECHHIAATSFKAFLSEVSPRYLLGLTATPERGDGDSILPFFDSRPDGGPAAELRLWDALDQQLLAPFEYYAISDPTDFSTVRWGKAASEKQDLGAIVLADRQRAHVVSNATAKYVDDPADLRALGFCVSVAHAELMADHFNSQGIPAATAHGEMASDARSLLRRRLESGEIKAIFSCDLYNEGIDFPFVNTILLLRPTDSPVVFTQQIGRGLRIWPGKQSCLVLDFVGQFGNAFRFDRLWRSVSGLSRRELVDAVESGFNSLPPGCVIQFDRKSREVVLANLRTATTQRWAQLTNELRAYHQVKRGGGYSISDFIRDQHIDLRDIYRAAQISGWTQLQISAGLLDEVLSESGTVISRRLHALLHHNDPTYLGYLRGLRADHSPASESDRRRLLMLGHQIFPRGALTISGMMRDLADSPALISEIRSLSEILSDASDIPGAHLCGAPKSWTISQCGRYSRAEILAAIGAHRDGHQAINREGLYRLPEIATELLFVTLDKSDGFHKEISYRDYAISPSEFHWETQNTTGPDTPAGKQYAESPDNGWRYYLFVRNGRDDPFHALGEVRKKFISGSRPMAIVWELLSPMPLSLFKEFSVLRT